MQKHHTLRLQERKSILAGRSPKILLSRKRGLNFLNILIRTIFSIFFRELFCTEINDYQLTLVLTCFFFFFQKIGSRFENIYTDVNDCINLKQIFGRQSALDYDGARKIVATIRDVPV